MKKKIQKNPEVIAWENWKDSKEGVTCLQGTAEGRYLENRLWLAFMAGK